MRIIVLLSIICAEAYGRRIYGGFVMNPIDVPYQAAMLINNEYKCGASFLSEKLVIGAGHCVSVKSPEAYRITGGGHYYSGDATSFGVRTIVTYDNYDIDLWNYHDIAIFVLKRVNNFPKHIKFVTLPKLNQEFKVGEKLFISGYGNTEYSNYNLELRGAVVPVYDHVECRRRYMFLTQEMICAGYESGGIDTCQGKCGSEVCERTMEFWVLLPGDSGGPMVKPEGTVLVGITSFGRDCGDKDYPGVYTKVSKYVNWIIKVADKYQ
jgi:secreted trypsin-like serine protease